MRLALAMICVVAAAQSREDLVAQQLALNQARQQTNPARAAELYQQFIDRYGGEIVWDEIAKRGLFSTMIETQVKREKWEAADRLGAAAIQRLPASDELNLRQIYAQVLDHLHKSDEARKQRAIIESLVKADLLASQIHQSAPPLVAKSLDGREVSLANLHGKAAIVAFWATWCIPCIDELRELNRAYSSIQDRAEVLAINTDDSAGTAAEFARKNEYRFTVYKSDASEWPASTIPQFFVIDAQGTIRFHFEGFEDEDHLFPKKIEWMLHAIGAN